jgi:hypothetical protein
VLHLCERVLKLTGEAFGVPRTPTSESEDEGPPPQYTHDHDESPEDLGAPAEGSVPRRKPGGYDSRIEQILYENPDMPIVITDAGKSLESGGRYIVYTIRTGVRLRFCSPVVEMLLT